MRTKTQKNIKIKLIRKTYGDNKHHKNITSNKISRKYMSTISIKKY